MNTNGQKKEIDVWEYLRIVLKRKWVLIGFAAVLLVLAAVNSFTTRPLYRATATILIEEPGSSMLNIQELLNYQIGYGNDYIGTYFNTQLRLLTSRSLAERVAKRMNLASRPEFQSPRRGRPSILGAVRRFASLSWLTPRPKRDAASEAASRATMTPASAFAFTILGGLIVTPVVETRLVDVSYTSPYPRLAADVVNALVEEFITFSVETRYEATQQASEFLNEQIAQLREDLGVKERELQKYGEEKKLLFLNANESSVVNKFADVNTAFTEAQIDRFKKEATYRELRDVKLDALPQFVNNPLIQSLKTSYVQIKNEVDEKSKTYRADHPEMIRLKARLDSTQSELQSELQKAVGAAEADYRAALNKETSLQGLLDTQRTDVVRTNNNSILYNSLKIEVDNKRTLLTSLISKQNETLVSARLGGLRTSNIKIIDPALVPGGPFTPNIPRNLMMALLLGLFGGLGLVFLFEYLDNTVKGPEDAEKITGLASLGIIPYLSPDGAKKRDSGKYGYTYGNEAAVPDDSSPKVTEIELVNHLFPKFSIAEDYRTIRTSILFSRADATPKVICFTSSLPQEGKSATISNLAVSFAQLEGRVLLIDADLRKPRLHKVFGARNTVGLSGYLAGRVPFEDAVQKTQIDNIWLMTSGPHPPNPAELLNSRHMRELIAQARERFDTVLIDTPPVLAVIDPVIVASLADATVVIVRAAKTTRKALGRAVAEIRKSKADVIGLVFNEVRIGSQAVGTPYYHYYQYEYAAPSDGSRAPGQRGEIKKP